MRRLATLAAALLLAAPVPGAFAHAVVTGTSLPTTPLAARHATEVLLRFNSAIEIGLSRVFLVSAGDRYQPLQARAGKKPGELRVGVPALEPGEYAIKFRILAADGHVTEDIIHFRVAP